jgi:hypothetical protein
MTLQAHEVPCITLCLNLGDIGDDIYHSMQTHLIVNVDWAPSPKPAAEFTPHRHYCIVLDTIGTPLKHFKCSQDMHAIHDSLIGEFFESWNVCFTLMDDITSIAHKVAYKHCGVLHHDISPSNILILENDGGGFLIDWDLCKNVNSTKHKAHHAAHTVRIECLLICAAVLMNWHRNPWQFMAADLITDPNISQTFIHDL